VAVVMQVAILGCGPAGLLAAHAVAEAGHEPIILSRKVKSPIFGAQYLHRHIRGLNLPAPEHQIDVIKAGCREGYAENVYGTPDAPVSWDKFDGGVVPGWNMQKAYDNLWGIYDGITHDVNLDAELLHQLSTNYPIIYSTIPADMICAKPDEHKFYSQGIYVVHGPGVHLIEGVNDGDIMYYNGYTPDGRYGNIAGFSWYRFSQINKYQSWEYRERPAGDQIGWDHLTLSEGRKPISTSCGCWPRMIKVGRFGAWDKQILTHHVYERVLGEVGELVHSAMH
jgi:hypothetical protein